MTITLNGLDLTIEEVVSVARERAAVDFSPEAIESVVRAEAYVAQKLKDRQVIYGLTTGFGSFCNELIDSADAPLLQRNLILSHACAMGEPLPTEIVRAVMLLRINTLTRGHSGIRMETLNTLLGMLNAGVHPVIPEKGSLGASGDLALLAHMVLPMLGEGKAEYKGEILPGAEAMRRAGLPVLELAAKEGLALINGTQIMAAIGCIAVYEAEYLVKAIDIATAMTAEALLGIKSAFDERLHALRGHAGQIESAANLMRLLEGSELARDINQNRVQDAYSLRCAPQVHGASRDAVRYAREVISREINAVTDNPILFPDENDVISGGNFHGQPVALAMDFLGIALSELADISERRIERLVNPQLSQLPAFLVEDGGLNSGFMITQYSAASMVSENKVYAHPASVDSIPSSANQEDHVSMGTTAARKALMILDNAQKVVGIEFFCASQALSFRDEGMQAPATHAVYSLIRGEVAPVKKDILMHDQMIKFDRMVKDHSIVRTAERVCGRLQ
ncbi:histidine ammonia-lyase [Eubacteriales bacterium OttesenSCG-928-A19]|nr:histidine ammonia-lyase [Eubacteriales bacterium OttesenSCG-928-A19]